MYKEDVKFNRNTRKKVLRKLEALSGVSIEKVPYKETKEDLVDFNIILDTTNELIPKRDISGTFPVKFKTTRGDYEYIRLELTHSPSQYGWVKNSKAVFFLYWMDASDTLYILDREKAEKVYLSGETLISVYQKYGKSNGSDKGSSIDVDFYTLRKHGILLNRIKL